MAKRRPEKPHQMDLNMRRRLAQASMQDEKSFATRSRSSAVISRVPAFKGPSRPLVSASCSSIVCTNRR